MPPTPPPPPAVDENSQRSPRDCKQAANQGDMSSSKDDESSSSSAVASPGSWNVDRGRSRVRRPSNPFSEDNLRRKGYHTIVSSFNKVFHLEQRWKLVRELGSGAYGVVISAADEISGETVAIKLVTRVFEKLQFAKRALREIALLRHFSHHSNITGLIDVDAISPDFSEIYIFMEPMEADLHQIIRSGQTLTNEHVQYFVYQILRGMKYIHSAGVIHRDLKPGNLLVNADCELKICDFGLARGFDATPDENASHLTEKYNQAIDVWSIGCILAELLMGVPLFKGKDYVDQLNKIFAILGTPDSAVIRKIGSSKAQAYVRSLPVKKVVPFQKIIPKGDPQALELLDKMLYFDPTKRVTVPQALEHPWLSTYHDPSDEPDCPVKFEQWREIEKLETMEEFRESLWKEIEDYRSEVRGIEFHLSALSGASTEPQPVTSSSPPRRVLESPQPLSHGLSKSPSIRFRENVFPPVVEEPVAISTQVSTSTVVPTLDPEDNDLTIEKQKKEAEDVLSDIIPAISPDAHRRSITTPTDPLVQYARRSSIFQPSRQGSTYNSPLVGSHIPSFIEGTSQSDPNRLGQGTVAFPTSGFVVPARSRTGSTAGGEPVTRKLLRTLSTVSIHESVKDLPGGLAGIAPIGKYITQVNTEADAPPSEVTKDFGIGSEGDDDDEQADKDNTKPRGRFQVG